MAVFSHVRSLAWYIGSSMNVHAWRFSISGRMRMKLHCACRMLSMRVSNSTVLRLFSEPGVSSLMRTRCSLFPRWLMCVFAFSNSSSLLNPMWSVVGCVS